MTDKTIEMLKGTIERLQSELRTWKAHSDKQFKEQRRLEDVCRSHWERICELAEELDRKNKQ